MGVDTFSQQIMGSNQQRQFPGSLVMRSAYVTAIDTTTSPYTLHVNFGGVGSNAQPDSPGIRWLGSSPPAINTNVVVLQQGRFWYAVVPYESRSQTMPWHIEIDTQMTPLANTNFNVIVVDANCIFNGYLGSNTLQNSQIQYWVVLDAGSWTYEQMYLKTGESGIYTVSLAGPETITVGTIDGYVGGGGNLYNVRSSLTFTVAQPGLFLLTVKMATKNALSTAYTGRLQHMTFRRTA